MENIFELVRVTIPADQILLKGKTDNFFDILENSQNLTEEFLYAHQPTTKNTISVYSTSDKKIGSLDEGKITDSFNIISGPSIIVARKGYAGRLYVVEEDKFIVHEDAYPIKPKEKYNGQINLWWFVGHYSMEFQSDRTSFWGIGDFPRERFKNQNIIIPKLSFQNKVAELYKKRFQLIEKTNQFKEIFYKQVHDVILNLKS